MLTWTNDEKVLAPAQQVDNVGILLGFSTKAYICKTCEWILNIRFMAEKSAFFFAQ
jgi:hypothetical protein